MRRFIAPLQDVKYYKLHVVVSTITHALGKWLFQYNPSMIIVDEGSQTLVSDLLGVLNPLNFVMSGAKNERQMHEFMTSVKSLVIVGDTQQMPPTLFIPPPDFTSEEASKFLEHRQKLEISLQSVAVENLPEDDILPLQVGECV